MGDVDDRFFFLGRIVDPATGKPTGEQLLYDPAELTTHGMITGMTGSGKTGLGVAFLEEAALKGIPAVVVDPKGDLTNLLLHFPDLAPSDFEPWIDPEAARRENKPLTQLAAETAARWRDGLAGWGLGREQLLALRNAAHYTIFTPGSTAGVPLNTLASLAAPDLPWEQNQEVLREKAATVVTALLNLVGVPDADPLRSREHILLANLIEQAWSSGRSLDLAQLILATQRPPFDRLGAFPMESFYPEEDRFDLAMLLNNFLASPSFQTWMLGEALDIGAMLYAGDGRPRHNIFYLAHLSEPERMFVVSLLFAAIEGWMRTQRGTGNLRLLVYFDEIMGYMPPVANPPPRAVMLRMLKQARAFGVGLLFATQNPVDVDYKAMANAGTWLIGRLQTEQDKQRLMDGLRGASGAVDLKLIDRAISGLGKRTFLMHSVHSPVPVQFTTRWVMNYLAGPLTRSQVETLTRRSGTAPAPAEGLRSVVSKPSDRGVSAYAQAAEARYTAARPAVPSGVDEVFLSPPPGRTRAGAVYSPALYAEAEIRYLQRKYGIDSLEKVTCLVEGSESGRFDWEDHVRQAQVAEDVQDGPQPGVQFEVLPGWLSDVKALKELKRDFAEWLYRTRTLRVRVNEQLRVFAGPEVSPGEFRRMCSEAAAKALDERLSKIKDKQGARLEALRRKIELQELEIRHLQEELNARKMDEIGSGLEAMVGLFGGRRRSISSNLSKRRMTAKTGNRLEQERLELQGLRNELAIGERELQEAIQEARASQEALALAETEFTVTPARTGIFVERFGIAWVQRV